jgi:kumamolisin
MQMRHPSALFVITATLFFVCASAALAQSGWNTVTIPPSSAINAADIGVRAHTNIQILGSPQLLTGVPQLSGPPFPGYFYETPASLSCVYYLEAHYVGCNPYTVTANPTGGKKAIAIVDAYDDPAASSDLNNFSSQFGLPAPNFSVVYAPYGGANPGSCVGPPSEPPSAFNTGWDVEESLDIEWAHAMAPNARLYLVEAQSNLYSDLLCAVTVASNLVSRAGGGEVSMSWGGGEFSEETMFDGVFTTPTVVYFASSGDSPGVMYPSASPNVVAVGGTSIGRNSIGNFVAESVWQVAGGGPSAYEVLPTYQHGVASTIGGNYRGVPDVASDANPYTGVWVLDTLGECASTGIGVSTCGGPRAATWWVVGGTSVSSPVWAGIVNAAGSFAASSSAELTKLYGDNGNGALTFISTGGSCGPYMGYLDLPGWNFCTGLGSPKGYLGK